jgi:hypothetical protein
LLIREFGELGKGPWDGLIVRGFGRLGFVRLGLVLIGFHD